jgi:hypothetical protein
LIVVRGDYFHPLQDISKSYANAEEPRFLCHIEPFWGLLRRNRSSLVR